MFEPNELAGSEGRPRYRPLRKSFAEMGREAYGAKFRTGEYVWEKFNKAALSVRPGGEFYSSLSFDDLHKALATANIAGLGNAQPLLLENLDSMMTEVLITSAHLRLFNTIPRVPSIQPNYQWIRHLSYGTTRRAPGFAEGGAPNAGVSSWVRSNLFTKFMGVKRGVTHPAMLTGQLGGSFIDPTQSENRDGTLQLLEMIERWLIWGDLDIHNQADVEVNYDGIYQQLLNDGAPAVGSGKSIIDKLGQPLTFEDIENAGTQFVERGKLLDFSRLVSFGKPRVFSDLAKLKFQAERIMMGANVPAGYSPGVPLKGFATQRGWIPFEDSILLDPVGDGSQLPTPEPGAATKPPTLTGVEGASTTSTMTAGTYYYFTSVLNDTGESDTRASAAVIVSADGKKVTLTAGFVANVIAYRFYRGTLADGSDAGWIATVKQTAGPDATYDDLNQIMPNTGIFIIFNAAEEDIALAQMSPLIKWPLPPADTTINFILMLYHVLAVKAPERVIFFKNIGRRP